MSAVVRVVGRFAPSEMVELVRVAGEHVLTAAGGRIVSRAKVDDGGLVEFTEGVDLEARYFVRGYRDGQPFEVRATGVDDADATHLGGQAPVGNDRVKFANGEPVPAVVSAAEVPVDVDGLKGQALKDRAAELDIEGRGSMKADELRAAIRAAQEEPAAA